MNTTWFLPSFYGDVTLKADGKQTLIEYERVTASERAAMKGLLAWAKDKGHAAPDEAPDDAKGRFEIDAPLAKVRKALFALMKPGRDAVEMVRLKDGAIEEVDQQAAELKEDADKGATVAKPTRGCPMPAFVNAEIKARAVLEAFLDPSQLDDFRRHNRFVSVGAATGHRYMVTSRHALSRWGEHGRTLYDLDDRTPFCVHDFSVPAAEEVLAVHLMLQAPRHEAYLRYLE